MPSVRSLLVRCILAAGLPGCADVSSNLSSFLSTALAVLLAAVLVAHGGLLFVFRRFRLAPRWRALATLPAAGVLGVATVILVRELLSDVPLTPAESRMLVATLPLSVVPVVAASSGWPRRLTGSAAVLWLAVAVSILVHLAPGSRLPPGRVVDVAVGSSTVCTLHESGGVACVGSNFAGEAGLGHRDPTHGYSLTVPVPRARLLRGLASGFCVLSVDDQVWCWGAPFGDTPGALGDGDASLDLPTAGVVTVGEGGHLRYLRGTARDVALGSPPYLGTDDGPCRLEQGGRVLCGDRPIALPGPAARLRGARGLVCALVEEGERCWGRSATVELAAEARKAHSPWFGTTRTWDTPAPLRRR